MQFKDDIGAVVNTFAEMIPALRKTFHCLRVSGLKLSAHKGEYGTTVNDCLISTTTPKRKWPESV